MLSCRGNVDVQTFHDSSHLYVLIGLKVEVDDSFFTLETADDDKDSVVIALVIAMVYSGMV